MKRFWTGLRHLNDSHWFDYKNEVIQFSENESSWWPWLVIDSRTYAQGSCVAKRRGAMFLDDCYKRMPFACQLVLDNRLTSFPSATTSFDTINDTSSFKMGEMIIVWSQQHNTGDALSSTISIVAAHSGISVDQVKTASDSSSYSSDSS